MKTPYRPGQDTQRQYSDYNPRQEALWRAMDDSYHAHYFGFAHTRQPKPGEAVDTRRYERWLARVEAAWEKEARGRGGDTHRGIKRRDWPEHLWRYFYQRCLAAPRVRVQEEPPWTE